MIYRDFLFDFLQKEFNIENFEKMSHIYYKFASELTFSNVNFDGLHISVLDLKKAIIHQKRLGKSSDFDLQVRIFFSITNPKFVHN